MEWTNLESAELQDFKQRLVMCHILGVPNCVGWTAIYWSWLDGNQSMDPDLNILVMATLLS